MARNSQIGNHIDGGIVVMVSQLLKRNISIISTDNIWNCQDSATDIAFIFGGEDKFIPTEVSTSTFVLLSMFIVHSHLPFYNLCKKYFYVRESNLTTV